MKYLKFLLPIALLAVGCGYWCMRDTPDAKIRALVNDGRKDFQLSEVFGTEWKVLCLLPLSYNYHTVENKGLLDWLRQTLGDQNISSDIYTDMIDDGGTAKIITSPPMHETKMNGRRWGVNDKQVIACTENPQGVVSIKEDGEEYKLLYVFDKEFKLNP